MPCWVLPAVAAQMWGVPLTHVLAQIDAGTLSSRVEDGSLLVDVGPVGDVSHAPVVPAVIPPEPVEIEPVLLSDAELSALFHAAPPSEPTTPTFVRSTVFRSESPSRPRGGRRVRSTSGRRPLSAPPPVSEPEPEELPPDEVDDGKPMNWREVRSRVGRTRRPPPSRGS